MGWISCPSEFYRRGLGYLLEEVGQPRVLVLGRTLEKAAQRLFVCVAFCNIDEDFSFRNCNVVHGRKLLS